jgi:hypothetical protein
MNGQALVKTFGVHVLGLFILLSPASGRIRDGAPHRPDPLLDDFTRQLAGPAVFVHAAHDPDANGPWPRSPGHSAETGCPAPLLVDTEAIPAFALIGDGRPFQHVRGARYSPAFCIRIDRHGRVARLRLANDGTGNPAADHLLALEVAALRFQPARRHGAQVSAWHRLTINLYNTVPDGPPLPPQEPPRAPMLLL